MGPKDVIAEKYRILRELGRGGHARVFEVEHVQLEKRQALKVLRATMGADVRDRFLREARSAALLDHPHVVKVSDFGQTADGNPYMVMELVEGISLAEKLDREGALPVRTALELTRDILRGVQHAHRNGLVHRDLKPHNVMLADSGGVKIVDFGLAGWSQRIDPNRITQDGEMFGTPSYMSPEQASADAVDHRTDLYALGLMLYEMLVGRAAFEGDTPFETLRLQVEEEVPPLPEEVAHQWPDLPGLLRRATQKDPDLRFDHAESFRKAVEDLLHPPVETQTLVPPRHRNARLPWVLGATAVLVILCLAILL